MKILAIDLFAALFVLAGLQSTFAKEADNRAYVQSGPDGVFYARCIPDDATGSGGFVDIYFVRQDRDELVDHYVFSIQLVQGKKVSFDILTGDQYRN